MNALVSVTAGHFWVSPATPGRAPVQVSTIHRGGYRFFPGGGGEGGRNIGQKSYPHKGLNEKKRVVVEGQGTRSPLNPPLTIHSSTCMSICLSLCQSLCLSLCLSVYLYVYLSIFMSIQYKCPLYSISYAGAKIGGGAAVFMPPFFIKGRPFEICVH